VTIARPDDVIVLRYVREHGPLSGGVAWFSQGQVSHCGAIMPRDSEWPGYELGARSDLVAGMPRGVQVRRPNYAPFSRSIIVRIPCTTLQKQSFYAFLISQLKKPYDYDAIFGFIADRDWRHPGAWICSELLTAAKESCEIIRPVYLAANKITPVMSLVLDSELDGVTLFDAIAGQFILPA